MCCLRTKGMHLRNLRAHADRHKPRCQYNCLATVWIYMPCSWDRQPHLEVQQSATAGRPPTVAVALAEAGCRSVTTAGQAGRLELGHRLACSQSSEVVIVMRQASTVVVAPCSMRMLTGGEWARRNGKDQGGRLTKVTRLRRRRSREAAGSSLGQMVAPISSVP